MGIWNEHLQYQDCLQTTVSCTGKSTTKATRRHCNMTLVTSSTGIRHGLWNLQRRNAKSCESRKSTSATPLCETTPSKAIPVDCSSQMISTTIYPECRPQINHILSNLASLTLPKSSSAVQDPSSQGLAWTSPYLSHHWNAWHAQTT